jgi:hypothetical protein
LNLKPVEATFTMELPTRHATSLCEAEAGRLGELQAQVSRAQEPLSRKTAPRRCQREARGSCAGTDRVRWIPSLGHAAAGRYWGLESNFRNFEGWTVPYWQAAFKLLGTG